MERYGAKPRRYQPALRHIWPIGFLDEDQETPCLRNIAGAGRVRHPIPGAAASAGSGGDPDRK